MGLSAACKSEPLAGTTETQDGAVNTGTSSGGTTGATGGTPSATGGTPSTTGGTTTSPGNGGTIGIGGLVDFSVLVSPDREVDILFMIDNSPSMDPKQSALAKNFPKMINVLQTIPDGSGGTSLPDVHIGVISSDMGAGSEGFGNCGRVLGDRGLLWGNDPNNPIASVAPNADPTSGRRSAQDPNWPVACTRASAGSRISRIQAGTEADKELRRKHPGRLLLPGPRRGNQWLRVRASTAIGSRGTQRRLSRGSQRSD